MKKEIPMGLILGALALAVTTGAALADDGEGMSLPRIGSPERAAYEVANAQYMKDDGNNAYHLQGISVLYGTTLENDITLEVDFNSGEDGDYDYKVQVRKVDGKWTAAKAVSVTKNN